MRNVNPASNPACGSTVPCLWEVLLMFHLSGILRRQNWWPGALTLGNSFVFCVKKSYYISTGRKGCFPHQKIIELLFGKVTGCLDGSLLCSPKFPASHLYKAAQKPWRPEQTLRRKAQNLLSFIQEMLLKAEVFCENVCLSKQGFHWENTQQSLCGKYIL